MTTKGSKNTVSMMRQVGGSRDRTEQWFMYLCRHVYIFGCDNRYGDEGQQEYCANDGVTYGEYYRGGRVREVVGSFLLFHSFENDM